MTTDYIFELQADGGLSFVRCADLLTFTVRNVGLVLDDLRRPRKLVRKAPNAFLVFELPPQAIVEETRLDPNVPAHSRMSGPTRLVFRLHDTVNEVALSVAGLLDWSIFDLVVRPASAVARPDPWRETAIEVPYGLFLSPEEPTQFEHAHAPVTRRSSVDMWQTRLLQRSDAGRPTRLRGLYARSSDISETHVLNLTRRQGIAKQSSGGPDVAAPSRDALINVEMLYLSALGANLGVHAAWDGVPLEGWVHRATFGRDHYIKVLEAGFLWPYGHEASYVEVAERDFTQDGKPAELKVLKWIVVKKARLEFTAETAVGRQFPYTSVELLTRVTPLIRTEDPAGNGLQFWPLQVKDATDFRFYVRAVDHSGNVSEFNQSLGFISAKSANDPNAKGSAAEVLDRVKVLKSRLDSNPLRSRVDLAGQAVAFAKDALGPATLGVTSLYLTSDTLISGTALTAPASEGTFLPVMAKANVTHPAVKQLLQGLSSIGDPSILVSYCDNYLHDHLQNDAAIFLVKPPEDPTGLLDFVHQGADKVGGIVAPSLAFSGFSQKLGVMCGGLKGFLNSNLPARFNPEEFLGDTKLFGVVQLSSLLDEIGLTDLEAIPQLKTLSESATKIERGFHWKTAVKKGADSQLFCPLDDSELSLSVVVTQWLTGGPPPTVVDGCLTNFSINVLAIICLKFNSIGFHRESDHSPTFKVDLASVSFKGGLSFLAELQKCLPSGASDASGAPASGPFVHVDVASITAGLTVAIPTITMGLFSLQNLAFTSDIQLHFSADPLSIDFALSDVDHPFLVSVGIFGGGGHFKIRIKPDKGVDYLEASIEFGGCVALNLGVASGGVHVLAGIYYRLENSLQKVSGFLRAGGSLEVLGIITVSVEFYLELSIESRADGVYFSGEAALTVTIGILFFHAHVTLRVHKEFRGSNPQPAQAMNLMAVGLLDQESLATSLGLDAQADASLLGAPLAREPHGTPFDVSSWQEYWSAFAA